MNTPDDVTLIQQFVARQTALTASPNFRIESTSSITQLLTQTGKLLARYHSLAQPAIVEVKQGIQPWVLLHQILSEHGFMLVDQETRLPGKQSDESGFICYQEQQIPIGYQMHCTEAKTLWKVWSAQTRPWHRVESRLELLLFTPSAWLPIQEMSCQRDVVAIKTLIKTVSVPNSHYVTWLQKTKVKDLRQRNRQPMAQTPNHS